jgi:hypothetical protein
VTGTVAGRLAAQGLELPDPLPPFGLYVPAVRTGDLVFLSGAGPVRPDGSIVRGRVGIGVVALPLGIPVEVEAVVQVEG